LQLVFNKVPPGMDSAALRQQAEAAYQTPVLAVLPLNFEIVHLASAGIFSLRHPDHLLAHALKAVAEYVMRGAVDEPFTETGQPSTLRPLSPARADMSGHG